MISALVKFKVNIAVIGFLQSKAVNVICIIIIYGTENKNSLCINSCNVSIFFGKLSNSTVMSCQNNIKIL